MENQSYFGRGVLKWTLLFVLSTISIRTVDGRYNFPDREVPADSVPRYCAFDGSNGLMTAGQMTVTTFTYGNVAVYDTGNLMSRWRQLQVSMSPTSSVDINGLIHDKNVTTGEQFIYVYGAARRPAPSVSRGNVLFKFDYQSNLLWRYWWTPPSMGESYITGGLPINGKLYLLVRAKVTAMSSPATIYIQVVSPVNATVERTFNLGSTNGDPKMAYDAWNNSIIVVHPIQASGIFLNQIELIQMRLNGNRLNTATIVQPQSFYGPDLPVIADVVVSNHSVYASISQPNSMLSYLVRYNIREWAPVTCSLGTLAFVNGSWSCQWNSTFACPKNSVAVLDHNVEIVECNDVSNSTTVTVRCSSGRWQPVGDNWACMNGALQASPNCILSHMNDVFVCNHTEMKSLFTTTTESVWASTAFATYETPIVTESTATAWMAAISSTSLESFITQMLTTDAGSYSTADVHTTTADSASTVTADGTTTQLLTTESGFYSLYTTAADGASTMTTTDGATSNTELYTATTLGAVVTPENTATTISNDAVTTETMPQTPAAGSSPSESLIATTDISATTATHDLTSTTDVVTPTISTICYTTQVSTVLAEGQSTAAADGGASTASTTVAELLTTSTDSLNGQPTSTSVDTLLTTASTVASDSFTELMSSTASADGQSSSTTTFDLVLTTTAPIADSTTEFTSSSSIEVTSSSAEVSWTETQSATITTATTLVSYVTNCEVVTIWPTGATMSVVATSELTTPTPTPTATQVVVRTPPVPLVLRDANKVAWFKEWTDYSNVVNAVAVRPSTGDVFVGGVLMEYSPYLYSGYPVPMMFINQYRPDGSMKGSRIWYDLRHTGAQVYSFAFDPDTERLYVTGYSGNYLRPQSPYFLVMAEDDLINSEPIDVIPPAAPAPPPPPVPPPPPPVPPPPPPPKKPTPTPSPPTPSFSFQIPAGEQRTFGMMIGIALLAIGFVAALFRRLVLSNLKAIERKLIGRDVFKFDFDKRNRRGERVAVQTRRHSNRPQQAEQLIGRYPAPVQKSANSGDISPTLLPSSPVNNNGGGYLSVDMNTGATSSGGSMRGHSGNSSGSMRGATNSGSMRDNSRPQGKSVFAAAGMSPPPTSPGLLTGGGGHAVLMQLGSVAEHEHNDEENSRERSSVPPSPSSGTATAEEFDQRELHRTNSPMDDSSELMPKLLGSGGSGAGDNNNNNNGNEKQQHTMTPSGSESPSVTDDAVALLRPGSSANNPNNRSLYSNNDRHQQHRASTGSKTDGVHNETTGTVRKRTSGSGGGSPTSSVTASASSSSAAAAAAGGGGQHHSAPKMGGLLSAQKQKPSALSGSNGQLNNVTSRKSTSSARLSPSPSTSQHQNSI